MTRRRHPAYYLTDAELDRFDDGGLNDPIPAHLLPGPGVDCLAVFGAEVQAIRATFHNEREAS